MNTSSAAQMTNSANGNAAAQFVINLCSSTSPMALAHPSSPELKRYTFFVSRQREDGRERFRLHMGYFISQQKAEELLGAVRDVYPAAWAGPAPVNGVARRGRISPVQLAPAVAQAATASAAPVAPAPFPAAPSLEVSAAPAAIEKVVAPVAPVAAVAPVAPTAAADNLALEQTMSDMRNVLAQLGDDAPTVQHKQPLPQMLQPAQPAAVQPARPADPPRLQPVAPKVAAPRAAAVELTPVQALKVLETQEVPTLSLAASVPRGATSLAPPAAPFEAPDEESAVPVVTPEDTQTLRDIKLDKANNAPPCFAVQLVFSVSPIDVAAMPHMAIFDAYTLYNVEGNRQGRKWYGLRLGFFSDPNSATQVANYVRGDYRSVAVIPVASKERDNAMGTAPVATISPNDSGISPPQRAAEHLSTNREAMQGFELVNDDRPAPQKRDLDTPAVNAPAKTAAKSAQSKDPEAVKAAVRAKLDKVINPGGADSPARPQGKGKRVVARKKPDATHVSDPGRAAVLESTLEMLGASTLTLDTGKGNVMDEAATRKRTTDKKNSNGKFSKLLSRLSRG
ncbi:MAG: hypothetical protein WDO12_07970 [Pseudomonadota bacterium]